MKNKLSRLILCGLMLLTFPLLNYGQARMPELGTIINDPDFAGGSGGPIATTALSSSCIYEEKFTMFLSHLEGGHGFYYLPEGYPPMGLRITIGNSTTCVPLHTFKMYSTHVYYTSVTVNTNLANYCLNSNGSFQLDWSAEVIEYNTEGGDCASSPLYGLCDYRGTGDIYDCTIFDIPCGGSTYSYESRSPDGGRNIPGEGCNLDVFSGEFNIACGDCDGRLEPQEEPHELSIRNGENSETLAHPLEIAPNPFDETTVIRWFGKEETPQKIDLIDASGHLLKSWERSTLENRTFISLNGKQLSSGLYFVRISYANKLDVKRLVKL